MYLSFIGGAKKLNQLAKEAMSAANTVMDSYNKVLELEEPWEKIHATLRDLDKFRDDYSKPAYKQYINIRYYVSNGISTYNTATYHVYDWCVLATPLLKKYIELYNDINETTMAEQKEILIKLLDDGLKDMDKAKAELANASGFFNSLAGELTTFRGQLQSDFSDQSDYLNERKAHIRKVGYASASIFGPIGLAIAAGIIEGKLIPELKARLSKVEQFYNKLDELANASLTDISASKQKIQKETRIIGDLKTEAEELNTYASIEEISIMKDIVIETAEKLISSCNKYKKRIAPFTPI